MDKHDFSIRRVKNQLALAMRGLKRLGEQLGLEHFMR